MKFFKSCLLIIITTLFFGVSCEEDDVVVTFTDHRFEMAIREAIDKPSGDIYEDDLSDLLILDISYRDISDMNGIEYCVNLKELWARENRITSIEPLVDLTTLKHLDLNDNQLDSDLSIISNLVNLEHLEVAGNEVSDIMFVENLTQLKYELDLSRNLVTDISAVEDLTQLRELALNDNQIEDLTPLLTCLNQGGFQPGAEIKITYNNMNLVASSVNRDIVDTLLANGVFVEYAEGNTVDG